MIQRTTMMMVTLLMMICSGVDGMGQETWVKTYGGSGHDEPYSSILSMSGHIYVTGCTESNDGDFIQTNRGLSDVFIIKTDRDGTVLWKKTFGGTSREWGISMTSTNDDGIILTGYTESNDGDFSGLTKGQGDIFVIKLDNTGNVKWTKIFGGSEYDWGRAILSLPDGSVIVSGETRSNDGDFRGLNKGGTDVFVMKLDPTGQLLWKETLGGKQGDWARSMTIVSNREFLLTGYTESNDGDFNEMSNGNWDIFVVRLDDNGRVLWRKTLGGTTDEKSRSICDMSDRTHVIVGDIEIKGRVSNTQDYGDKDVLITKVDTVGSEVWTKKFGGMYDDYGVSVCSSSDDGVILTGSTLSNDQVFSGLDKRSTFRRILGIRGGEDVFLVKLDSKGRIVWKQTFGGTYTDLGKTVLTTSEGGILLIGCTDSDDCDFNNIDKGGQDIFIMKLDRDGNLTSKK